MRGTRLVNQRITNAGGRRNQRPTIEKQMEFLLFSLKWMGFTAGIVFAGLISAYWCIRLFLYWDDLSVKRSNKWQATGCGCRQ